MIRSMTTIRRPRSTRSRNPWTHTLAAGVTLAALLAGPASVAAGSPAGAAGTAPTVSGFTPSVVLVSAAGGPVGLSAQVVGGVSCTFSASPALAGLPATVPCSGGTATDQATIPLTTKKAGVKYSFSLTAVGPGGKRSRAVKAVVRELSVTIPTTITGTVTTPPSSVWPNSVDGTFTFALDPATGSACSLTGECAYDLVDLTASMTGNVPPDDMVCDGLTLTAPAWNGALPSGELYLGPWEPAKNRIVTMSFGATVWVPNCTFATQFNHNAFDLFWTPGQTSLSMNNEGPAIGSAQIQFHYA